MSSELECARLVLEVTPRLMRWLAGRMGQHPDLANFTIPQFRVLHYVQQRGGCSQSEVARWRDVAAPTMSRTVDSLVEKGLLERRRSPDDRRRAFLYLTPKGESYLAGIHAHMEERLAARLEGCTYEQREAIAAGLRALASLLGHDLPHGASPD